MTTDVTIIEGIGWNRDYIAAFQNDERILFEKVNPETRYDALKEIKKKYQEQGLKCYELKCSGAFTEFVSVSDFPKTLKEYFH